MLRYLRHLPLICILVGITATAQTPDIVSKMAANEVDARNGDVHFSYIAEERSSRTAGHLWREKAVETDEGPLHRLLAIDGKPLDAAAASAEANRISELVKDPGAFRRLNAAHNDDEAHAAQLLQLLPKAFLITPAGTENGCTRLAFRPDPSFEPSSYEERAVHAMQGTVSIKQPVNRLCSLSATIGQPVEFGFGLLGRIEPGGHFSLERVPVDATNWKSDGISVHIEGRILLLKSFTKEQDVRRTNIQVVPQHLSLADAARLTQP